MSKITARIDNYDSLSVEEKLKALEEIEDQQSEVDRYKAANNKLSAENADWKRKERERMSEEDKNKLDREEYERQTKETIDALNKTIDGYRRDANISASKSAYIGMGMDEKTAHKIAEMEVDGKLEDVHSLMKGFIEGYSKRAVEDSTRRTPAPRSVSADGYKGVTKEQFAKMGYTELAKMAKEDPETYNAMVGRKDGE